MSLDESPDSSERTYLLALPSTSRGRVIINRWTTCAALILLATVFERAAFYSIQGSLSYFLMKEPLCWDPGHASTANYVIFGFTYFLSIAAGMFSDILVSAFPALVTGYVAYLVGYSFAPAFGFMTDGPYVTNKNENDVCSYKNYTIAFLCPSDVQPTCIVSVYTTLVFVAFGSSILRAVIAPFGADQVREQGLSVTRSFFSWYYWCVNFGSLIAHSTMAYLQQKDGFGIGFLTPLMLLLLSFVVFIAGSCWYSKRSVNRAAVGDFFAILCGALRTLKAQTRGEVSKNLGCFEYSKVINGGAYSAVAVDKVKAVGWTFMVLLLMLPYFVVYARIMTTFSEESLHMSVGADNQTSSNPQVPAALLTIFNDIGLMVALPLCNLVIYPLFGRRGFRMTMHKRIATGMAIGVLCLVTAGTVEIFRARDIHSGHPQLIGNTYYNASSLSVFWQIPQYFLLGCSEAFAIVTAMEFTYISAPRSMPCVMMGMFWMFVGLGDFINLALPSFPYFSAAAAKPSVYQQYFYFMVAGVLFAGTVIFILIGHKFDLGLDTLTVAAARPKSGTPVAPRRDTKDYGGTTVNGSNLSGSSSALLPD